MDPDGLPMREVNSWTSDKLALLAYYLDPFAKLCHDKAGGWYFLDGFAGNGANDAGQLGTYKGSALIGATQNPQAKRVVLVEKSQRSVRALRKRCERARPDALVIAGNCNEVIRRALSHFDDRQLPAFCVLDPEGMELAWETVETCATAREKNNPDDEDPALHELLIYFSTPGVRRTAAVTDQRMIAGDEQALRRVFGNDAWRPIAERSERGPLAERPLAVNTWPSIRCSSKSSGMTMSCLGRRSARPAAISSTTWYSRHRTMPGGTSCRMR